MKYFAAFLPMLDKEKSESYRQEHLDYLQKMGTEGKIFAKGRFADGAGGLVIYVGTSLEEVQPYAANDPYVLHEARGLELHEWDMSLDSNFNK